MLPLIMLVREAFKNSNMVKIGVPPPCGVWELCVELGEKKISQIYQIDQNSQIDQIDQIDQIVQIDQSLREP